MDIKSVTEFNDNNVMFKYVFDIVRWIKEAVARKEKVVCVESRNRNG